jgi:hypothetical protein
VWGPSGDLTKERETLCPPSLFCVPASLYLALSRALRGGRHDTPLGRCKQRIVY